MTSTTLASTSSFLYAHSTTITYAHDVKEEQAHTMTSRAMSSSSSCSTSKLQHISGLLDPASGLTRVVKCTLDEDQCLSLQDILASFQTAINEEQAWALCYQAVKCFSHHYQSSQNTGIALVTSPAHLYIHKDGFVHQKSLFPSKETKRGATNEGKCAPVCSNQLLFTFFPAFFFFFFFFIILTVSLYSVYCVRLVFALSSKCMQLGAPSIGHSTLVYMQMSCHIILRAPYSSSSSLANLPY